MHDAPGLLLAEHFVQIQQKIRDARIGGMLGWVERSVARMLACGNEGFGRGLVGLILLEEAIVAPGEDLQLGRLWSAGSEQAESERQAILRRAAAMLDDALGKHARGFHKSRVVEQREG